MNQKQIVIPSKIQVLYAPFDTLSNRGSSKFLCIIPNFADDEELISWNSTAFQCLAECFFVTVVGCRVKVTVAGLWNKLIFVR